MLSNYNGKFTCTVQGLDETLIVLDYEYQAGLSQLYSCRVNLLSEKPDLDYYSFLDKHCTMKTNNPGSKATQYINGLITKFTHMGKVGDVYSYQLLLEPHLIQLMHQEKIDVFLNQSIPNIITNKLKSARVQHCRFDLTQNYATRAFVCQYQETDYNFICRWMEHEGIYYYFEQDENYETLVLTDRYSTHKSHQYFSELSFNQDHISHASRSSHVIEAFSSQTKKVAKSLVLKSYHFDKDNKNIMSHAKISDQGVGKLDLFDENVLNEEDAKRIAEIRAQEVNCKAQTYHGNSTASTMTPGFRFKLTHHFNPRNNQEYLIYEIEQKGSQRQAVLSYLGNQSLHENDDALFITNFKAISGSKQYRSPRKTPIKRVKGIIPAILDAETSGDYAQLDNQGRYKIRLLNSDKADGQSSDWVRKMESYLGDQYGTHFPLHKGAEICLSFEFGNPDRPIIMGALHNSSQRNVVSANTQKTSVIKSAGGNMITMGDQAGQEYVHLYSPSGNAEAVYGQVSSCALGMSDTGSDSPAVPKKGERKRETLVGDSYAWQKGNSTTTSIGDTTSSYVGNIINNFKGNATTNVHGDSTSTTYGRTMSTQFGATTSTLIGNTFSFYTGLKELWCAGINMQTQLCPIVRSGFTIGLGDNIWRHVDTYIYINDNQLQVNCYNDNFEKTIAGEFVLSTVGSSALIANTGVEISSLMGDIELTSLSNINTTAEMGGITILSVTSNVKNAVLGTIKYNATNVKIVADSFIELSSGSNSIAISPNFISLSSVLSDIIIAEDSIKTTSTSTQVD